MRDSKMLELDAAYPEYGFADHKGYATERHLEAIRVHGECPEHRTVPADDADVDAEEELKAAKAVLSAISAERIAAKRQAAAAMRSRSPSATVRGTRTARTSRRAGF
uniref:RNase H type-2 domain-containing protein n=1 Tax=Neobodo designis TaxID=312471 RepID=A0A7S1L627_NEODS|mmetsp:Transcript_15387/g.47632  ORF Transcript_15387/g.47632 Transcript_15387/m.47632 type:complete len:107 (+) Transcript_15387:1-321(+)